MKKNTSFILITLLLITVSLKSQEISFDGEFRINPVYSLGFRRPMYTGDKPGFFTMQRTRLITTYKKKDDMDAEIILQDRRFWGDQSDREDLANMALYRGWVEKYFKHGFSIRLGRQGFVYDEQYILGDPNWVGTRAHDAALLKFERNKFKTHLAVAYNANGQELFLEPYHQNNYKNMAFWWIHQDFEKAKISFIAINRGMQKKDTTTMHYMQTFGPDLKFNITKNLTIKGLFYYQIGQTTSNKEVNAYFYSAQIDYDMTKNVNFNLGMDVGSGTNQTDLENKDNKIFRSFDRHYGLIHGHFGYIDYFYVNNPTLCGIADYYLKTKVNIGSNLSLENHLHYFNTQAKINDPKAINTTMPNYLGTEDDFLVNYKFSSNFKATLGYSIMFGTRTLDTFFGGKPSKNNQAVYVVITANTNFFKHKKD